MADCGCKGPKCKFGGPDDLQAFAHAVKVLYDAGLKSLGPCELCRKSKATTSVYIEQLARLWWDKFPGKNIRDFASLCPKCFKKANKNEPGTIESDEEAMF